eukprot:6788033-Pyramimonas_sp.AAC.1
MRRDDDETTTCAPRHERQQCEPVWRRHPCNLLLTYTPFLWPQRARARHRTCARAPPSHRE